MGCSFLLQVTLSFFLGFLLSARTQVTQKYIFHQGYAWTFHISGKYHAHVKTKTTAYLFHFTLMNVTITLILNNSFISSGYSSSKIRFTYVMITLNRSRKCCLFYTKMSLARYW
jgi:hypothetical protein